MANDLLIFLIDDDTDDQEIFSIIVREAFPNISCVFANDGIAALEKLQTEPTLRPDLIFIDINMPRMNGVQCLTEIKKLPHFTDVPVYMYSTAAEPAMVESCTSMGARGFIRKEVNPETLQKKIAEIISTL
jgi:CheY-like chemotaxis protein